MAISEAIYSLTRPAGAEGSDTTQYALGWIEQDGKVYLQWPDDFDMPISPARSAEGAVLVVAMAQRGLLTAQSAAWLNSLIKARSGGRLTLGEATPPEWRALMVDL